MKTLIIDGNNLLHRVFWIAKSKGQVGEGNYLHLYMFLNCIKRYVEQYQPDSIYCCWDEKPEKLKNVRGNLDSNYKANRNKETAVEVYAFNEQIKNLLQSLGIKNLFPLQYEADDVMCYLTRILPGTKAIITVDKDLFQLINDQVVVFEPIKKIEVTSKNFEYVTGTTQDRFVKTKALKGDKSDNVEGIKGFGEKTIERYFKGEIQLNEEQQLIFERNLQIMDLTLGGVSDSREVEYIQNQLDETISPSFDKFIKLCEEFDFQHILSYREKWNELFFFKNQYTSLLKNLFS